MGHKQKQQLKRARAERYYAVQNAEWYKKKLEEANQYIKQLEASNREYAEQLQHKMEYAIPQQFAGKGRTLQYAFFIDETSLAFMPLRVRYEMFMGHCDKCLKELNTKYPPANEVSFRTTN